MFTDVHCRSKQLDCISCMFTEHPRGVNWAHYFYFWHAALEQLQFLTVIEGKEDRDMRLFNQGLGLLEWAFFF